MKTSWLRQRAILLAIFAALVVFTPCAARAQDIEGDWQGILDAGAVKLHVAFHFTNTGDGLTATMDSIDQNVKGIPVTKVTRNESSLKMELNGIGGKFEGQIDKDLTTISGTWTQPGGSLPLVLKRAPAAAKTEHKAAKPSDIDGDWLGALDTGAVKLHVAFHFTNTGDGLTATMDSIDQNVKGIPVTKVTRSESSLKMELNGIGGKFEGQIDKDLTTISGTWTQPGGSFPLVLKRGKGVTELERPRPQEPVKPYPYREEEVAYANKAAGIQLAATLTIPPGKGPFPAVLLIAGSGPNNRDEVVYGHKPFLVLSDFLTRKGIVVLRADKRGVGKSGGKYATATTADFADDAEAGVAYLKTRPEVDHRRIGMIGHSEGGIIAPMVAARNPDVAFIVIMAGAGVPGDEILVDQLLLLSEAGGLSHEQAEKNAAEERKFLTLVEQEKDSNALEKKLRELAGDDSEARFGAMMQVAKSPWYRYFIEYDPAPALKKVTCPVLAITGEKDLQVPPRRNLPVIRQALEAAGNKDFEVDELSGLNHLFQTCRTGAVTEYAQIEETISPTALKKISDWVLKQPLAR
jgi:hypothetical protein